MKYLRRLPCFCVCCRLKSRVKTSTCRWDSLGYGNDSTGTFDSITNAIDVIFELQQTGERGNLPFLRSKTVDISIRVTLDTHNSDAWQYTKNRFGHGTFITPTTNATNASYYTFNIMYIIHTFYTGQRLLCVADTITSRYQPSALPVRI